MLTRDRHKFLLPAILMLGHFCTAGADIAMAAEQANDVIPGYESYGEVDFLSVDTGTVKGKELGKKGWHVVIEAPAKIPRTTVTLTAQGWDFMRLLPLRGAGGRLARPGESIQLQLPADGIGWFFLLNPFPEVTVRQYRPRTLFKLPDNTPRKAKYPVVDVHAHLRNVTAAQRLAVMDAVGVAIVIDSPLGMPTERSYERFEQQHPDRFLTLANIDFTKRFEEDFPADAIGKLRADAEIMRVPGITEVIDKGSGVYGNALVAEPRGMVHVDDAKMMPLWRAAARLRLPVLMHVAEPIWFYEPIDGNHEFLQWQSHSFRWNLSGIDLPSRDEMLQRRARIMTEVPELVVIGVHMGHLEDDLARLGEVLDEFPNFYVEMGVRHVYLGTTAQYGPQISYQVPGSNSLRPRWCAAGGPVPAVFSVSRNR